MLDVRDLAATDHAWADALLARHGGGSRVVARLGELVDPLGREGIVAELDGRPVALLTVTESDRGLEVLTLHSEVRGIGAGSRLLETALRVAMASQSPRLWLVTTNDNIAALRWYLRRGLHVAAVHAGGVDRDRAALKPEIPTTNPENGIPTHDYVELELATDAGREDLPYQPFPRIDDLDALPPEAAASLLGPLFENAPRFLERLAAERPFGDDATLIARAQEVARSMPEDEQVELLDAHPRIGADPHTVSAMSHDEQGYGAAEPEPEPWIAEELEMLNDAYERIFGFRFVIFVAGRPRSAIVPYLEASLRDDRVAEMRRGLDDVVDIAADRLARLRT